MRQKVSVLSLVRKIPTLNFFVCSRTSLRRGNQTVKFKLFILKFNYFLKIPPVVVRVK